MAASDAKHDDPTGKGEQGKSSVGKDSAGVSRNRSKIERRLQARKKEAEQFRVLESSRKRFGAQEAVILPSER
jgi:hypothetical protein